MNCANCGSDQFETDTSRGTVCCSECGMLKEENLIVNTVQYESLGSKSSMHGSVVNIDNKNIGTQFVDSSFYIKNTIKNICDKMNLSKDFIESSFRWYKLCLQYNISRGKSILYTLSACVYISCRRENTPHLLIDFSNELRIDVFKIGKVFLKIRASLNVDIALLDPTLYMNRFISSLKFKNKEILPFSIRLVSRMKKDWILMGRRPNNSCGAALLIASRIYNEPRDIELIAKTVHSSVLTINKRLKEISQTETANLGLEDFNKIWFETEESPPVVKQENKKQKVNLEIKNSLFQKKDKLIGKIGYSLQGFGLNVKSEFDHLFLNKKNSENSVEKENKEVSLEKDSFDENEFILNKSDVLNKTKMWESMYGEYLKEIEKKRKTKKNSSLRKKTKKNSFNSLEEVYQNLDKKISSKINYEAIEGLFEE